jgi:hypothetical protein
MIRLTPDISAPVERDSWTEDATLQPTTLRAMAGIPHRLSSSNVCAWELDGRSPTEAFATAALFARYCSHELDMDELPYRLQRTSVQHEESVRVWVWTVGAAGGGFRGVGAAACELDTQSCREDFWRMRFIWFYPHYRNRHLFSSSWSILLRRHQRLLIERPSAAMRIFLYHKPVWPMTTVQGETLKIYTELPYCGQHGAMQQLSEHSWSCVTKLADGTMCPSSYRAPAPRRAQ